MGPWSNATRCKMKLGRPLRFLSAPRIYFLSALLFLFAVVVQLTAHSPTFRPPALLTGPLLSLLEAARALAMQAATISFLPKPFVKVSPVLPAAPPPSRLKVTLVRSQHRSVSSATVGDREGSLSMTTKWAQKTVVVPAQKRGCHLIHSRIMREIEQDLSQFKCGLAHFFLQHTSASLTINENYDSDVQADTETFLNRIVPEGHSAPWRHTLEGPDDMPAHIKSSMFGCSMTIPITNGRLNMGTWQGIWLCEHRDHATPRKIVVTMNGMSMTQ